MSLEFTNDINRVYMCTSFEEYKKFDTTNMWYDKYGDGRLYWKQLTPKSVIGAASIEISDTYGKHATPDKYVQRFIVCAYPDFKDSIKRVNTLSVEWTFETIDESEQLKEFLDSTYCHIIHKYNENAEEAFKKRYGVNLKQAKLDHDNPNFDNYEKYINRYVKNYHILGIDNKTDKLNLYIVQWYDHNSLQYVEDRLDQFIKIADYRVLNY